MNIFWNSQSTKVCKQWNGVCGDDALWQPVLESQELRHIWRLPFAASEFASARQPSSASTPTSTLPTRSQQTTSTAAPTTASYSATTRRNARPTCYFELWKRMRQTQQRMRRCQPSRTYSLVLRDEQGQPLDLDHWDLAGDVIIAANKEKWTFFDVRDGQRIGDLDEGHRENAHAIHRETHAICLCLRHGTDDRIMAVGLHHAWIAPQQPTGITYLREKQYFLEVFDLHGRHTHDRIASSVAKKPLRSLPRADRLFGASVDGRWLGIGGMGLVNLERMLIPTGSADGAASKYGTSNIEFRHEGHVAFDHEIPSRWTFAVDANQIYISSEEGDLKQIRTCDTKEDILAPKVKTKVVCDTESFNGDRMSAWGDFIADSYPGGFSVARLKDPTRSGTVVRGPQHAKSVGFRWRQTGATLIHQGVVLHYRLMADNDRPSPVVVAYDPSSCEEIGSLPLPDPDDTTDSGGDGHADAVNTKDMRTVIAMRNNKEKKNRTVKVLWSLTEPRLKASSNRLVLVRSIAGQEDRGRVVVFEFGPAWFSCSQ